MGLTPPPDCRCRHNEPNQERDLWVVEATDKRGWKKIVCRICRRFIGYQERTSNHDRTSA